LATPVVTASCTATSLRRRRDGTGARQEAFTNGEGGNPSRKHWKYLGKHAKNNKKNKKSMKKHNENLGNPRKGGNFSS